MPIINICLALLIFVLTPGCNNPGRNRKNAPARVELTKKNEKYQLEVNGKPFFIKGAGLEFGDIEKLGSHGANSFRTWRTGMQLSGFEIDRMSPPMPLTKFPGGQILEVDCAAGMTGSRD